MNALKVIEETLGRKLTNSEKNLVFMAYAIGKADEKDNPSNHIAQ